MVWQPSPEDGKAYINGYTAFNSWARLALTITHEGSHRTDFLDKSWNRRSNVSTWKSEIKAWRQNGLLGDVLAVRMISKYQRLINIATKK